MGGIHVLPEVMGQFIQVAEDDDEEVPRLPAEQLERGFGQPVGHLIDILEVGLFAARLEEHGPVYAVAARLQLRAEGGRVGERALLGRAQPGDHDAIDFRRRIGHRHVDDGHPFARLARKTPEGRRLHVERGDRSQMIVVLAALHEVEDAVFARLDARGKGCPGRGRQDRHHRAQRPVASLLHQARQHRQLAGSGPFLCQIPGGAIVADHQQAIDRPIFTAHALTSIFTGALSAPCAGPGTPASPPG